MKPYLNHLYLDFIHISLTFAGCTRETRKLGAISTKTLISKVATLSNIIKGKLISTGTVLT